MILSQVRSEGLGPDLAAFLDHCRRSGHQLARRGRRGRRDQDLSLVPVVDKVLGDRVGAHCAAGLVVQSGADARPPSGNGSRDEATVIVGQLDDHIEPFLGADGLGQSREDRASLPGDLLGELCLVRVEAFPPGHPLQELL